MLLKTGSLRCTLSLNLANWFDRFKKPKETRFFVINQFRHRFNRTESVGRNVIVRQRLTSATVNTPNDFQHGRHNRFFLLKNTNGINFQSFSRPGIMLSDGPATETNWRAIRTRPFQKLYTLYSVRSVSVWENGTRCSFFDFLSRSAHMAPLFRLTRVRQPSADAPVFVTVQRLRWSSSNSSIRTECRTCENQQTSGHLTDNPTSPRPPGLPPTRAQGRRRAG